MIKYCKITHLRELIQLKLCNRLFDIVIDLKLE